MLKFMKTWKASGSVGCLNLITSYLCLMAYAFGTPRHLPLMMYGMIINFILSIIMFLQAGVRLEDEMRRLNK